MKYIYILEIYILEPKHLEPKLGFLDSNLPGSAYIYTAEVLQQLYGPMNLMFGAYMNYME